MAADGPGAAAPDATIAAQMVFSSPTFLFYFLPAVLAAYYLTPRRARNGILLAFSIGFYLWGAGAFTFILLGSIAVNYLVGLGVERAGDAGDRRRAQLWLMAGVVLNVGLLGWFKYFDFFIRSAHDLLHRVGLDAPEPLLRFTLPVGISFYVFHEISYAIDVYRGRTHAERDDRVIEIIAGRGRDDPREAA